MTGRDEALELYLQDLRRAAKLSVAQVCERTKIQSRFVEALEAGRFGEIPSNTHLRAFSLSIVQACGGDPERTALLVRRVLAAAAPTPTGGGARSFDTPPPAPAEAVRPLTAPPTGAPEPVLARNADAGRLAADGPALADEAPAHGLAAASARLRSLPLVLLLALLALAGTLSYGTSWGLERWRRQQALQAVAPVADAASADAVQPQPQPQAAAPAAPASAAAVPAAAEAAAAPAPAPASLELVLRARRDCWLVLEIDGQRLPTVTLRDGDKLRWPVSERARLLAGNVGALRVWWRGENLGYLGELGVRANALVFERGKAPRYDKAQALALPPGVPE